MLIFGMVWILLAYQATAVHSQKVDCDSGPCQNGALCEDTDVGFQCFCVDGYSGELCEINFDDCSSTPCRNNATCTDHVAGYTCLCSPGFTGQDCQFNIDECMSNPCLQNGTCIDLVNGFVCECFPPYGGDNCSLLPCDTVPCENEAICRNDVGFNESLSGFVCDCITGFSGPRCEINLEDCDLENLTSCSGNGLCVDGVNDYSCLCEPGWVGDYCDSPVDDCIGNSCKNNASCSDLHLGYLCTCKAVYEGSLCEREKDECSAWQPCKNGAVCVDLYNDYRCDCTEGWFGVNCSEEVNECENSACQNDAQCIDVIGGFQCRCPPFYTGLLCETLYNPCAQEYNPCQNNAYCIVPPDGQYRCFCLAGFTGVHCEVNVNECLSTPCENNSTCEDITAGYICHCTPGWEGQNCQDNIDDCAVEPCLNGADCMDLHNGFECNCTREYQGPVCDEIVDFCLKDPCFHESTCLSFVGGYKCVCSSPYTGEQCLDLIDACQSTPCINNGSCMNTVFGFQCNCPLPYTGKTCSERVDFCESGPCVLGTCVTLDNEFVCLCPEYITGKQCTDLVDYCQDSPCENEGNCINAEFDFRCLCAYGFTGKTCTQMIDFCSEEPCQNEANCSNIPGGFHCACARDYTGDLCQNQIPTVISSSIIITTSSFSDLTSLSTVALSTTPLSSYSTLFNVSTSSSYLSTVLPVSINLSRSFIVNPSSVIQHTPEATSIIQSINTSAVAINTSFSEITIFSSDSVSKSTLLTVSSTAHSHQSNVTTNVMYISSSDSFSPFILSTSLFSSASSVFAISSLSTATLTLLPDLSSDRIQISRTEIGSTSVQSSTVKIYPSTISSVSSFSIYKNISSSAFSRTTIPIPDSVNNLSSHIPVSEYSSTSPLTSVEGTRSITAIYTQNTFSKFSSSTFTREINSLLDTTSDFSLSPSSSVAVSDILSTMSFFYTQDTNTFELTRVTSSTLDASSKHSLISFSTVSVSDIIPTKSSSYIQNTFSSEITTTLFPTFDPSIYSPRTRSTFSVTVIDSSKLYHVSSTHSKESSLESATFKSSVSTVTLATSFAETHSFVASNVPQTQSSGFSKETLSLSIQPTSSSEKLSFSSRSLTLAPPSYDSTSIISGRTPIATSKSELSSSRISRLLTPYSVVDLSTYNSQSASSIVSVRPYISSSEVIFASSLKRSSTERSKTSPMFSPLATSFDTQTKAPSVDISNTMSDFEMPSTITSVFITLHSPTSSTFASVFSTFTAALGSSSMNTMETTSLSSSIMSSFQSAFETSVKTIEPSEELSFLSMLSEGPSLTRHNSYNSVTYTSIPITFASEHFDATTLGSSSRTSHSLMTESALFSTIPFTNLSSLFTEITSVVKRNPLVSSSLSSSRNILSSPFSGSSFYMSSRDTTLHAETLLPSKTKFSTLFLTESLTFVSTTVDFSSVSSYFILSTEISLKADSLSPGALSSSVPVSSDSIYLLSSLSVDTKHSIAVSQLRTTVTRSSEVMSDKTSAFQNTFVTDSELTTSTMPYISRTKTLQYSSSNALYSSSTTVTGSSDSHFISPVMQSSILTNTITRTGIIQPSQTTPTFSSTTSAPSTSCEQFACYNGGKCREDVSGTYCDCGEKYLDPQCKTERTACERYLCENGGTCVETLTIFNVQVPKCNCQLPFFGQRCENEKLIFYPTFIGSSYLEFLPPEISSDQSNEIYISVKTTQRDATILHSANQETDYRQAAFISLYLTNGKLRYAFSCDGVMEGVVESDMSVNTGDVYEVVIRQVWSAGPGEWCSAAVIINARVYVSSPMLTAKQSQNLGKLYLGGVPRYTYSDGMILNTHIMDGFIGCIHNFQVNKKEIDLITMATTGINIDNCNVPVCRHDPCKNGATCHSSGEEWYCSCLPGYGGALCERKLCDVNPCQHGGTCIILEDSQDQLCLCAYGRGGTFCEKALSVSVPHFIGDQYGYSSYFAYNHPHYVEDDLEFQFTIILGNGSFDSSLILFIGNTGSYDGRRDFLAVGIEFGYIVFRFDLGSGYEQIYSAEKLNETLHQHLIKFGRYGYNGWLQVDNQRNVTGRSPGILTALNTNSKLYIGNIDLSEIAILPTGAKFEDGFKGCIFNMKIKTRITNFLPPGSPPGHVVNGRNIGQCSSMSCEHSPCQNGAECRDLGASIYCICDEGWKGTFCTDIITVCDIAHACGDGSTCVPDITEDYHCLCPLGRRGSYCEQEMNISDPIFLGEGSYMAFEPEYVKRKIDIKLQVKPNTSEGLLFYVAQRLHSHAGDFLSLTINQGHTELRVDVGSGVNTIASEAELIKDRWYTIEAGRNVTHFYISVDGEIISAQLRGMMTFLDVTTDFYIGGLPHLEDATPDAFENEPVAFQGCIRELIINGKVFELDQHGAKDGRNIDDCDGTSCGYSVCSNEGNCSVRADNDFSCSCTESFIGRTCDIPIQCSNHSCSNGNCRADGKDSYVCDCFLGWKGTFCDDAVDFKSSVELKTGSFMYFVDETFQRSNKSITNASFAFRTVQMMCLILWNGQTYTDDEDYLGVGIQDGLLKLVWNLGWYSRGEIVTSVKFNDGNWHNVVIERDSQMLTLAVDGVTYESRVSGDFYTLDTRGEFFLGSFKKGNVDENTLGYFIEPFKGCLKDLQINRNILVDFNAARDGINILPCDPD